MTKPHETEQAFHFFRERFDIDEAQLATTLDCVLERGAEFADLFFEYTTQDSVTLEEDIIKTGSHHLQQGVGVRAIRDDRQGYAHSDEISLESLSRAAQTARAIAQSSACESSKALSSARGLRHDLYSQVESPTDVPIEQKVALVSEINAYARRIHPSIRQVLASVVTQQRNILIAASDRTQIGDTQPLVRLNVQVIAVDANGKRREIGYEGMGGRFDFARLADPAHWKPLVEEAVRVAVLNLNAIPCPAGTFDVVLGPGWPGILLHEAIGHGLEGDFNRKRTSAFTDRIGERVAAKGVTVVDDGTLPGRRGSIHIDDEGTPTQRNVLIEDGILRGYLQDKLNAKLMGQSPTGNGRRESYAHFPLPRMTNTFMLAGEESPEDILRSVRNGIYAVSFGGGQVDITSGKFVFSATEAYRIEDGRITAPIRGATFIGNGPDVLTRVSRIGSDLKLDNGIGTCGKDGQGVPVGVGLPTIRLDQLTVGGSEG